MGEPRDKWKWSRTRLPPDVRRDLRQRQTDAEELLWERLRDRQLGGAKFRRQYAVANTPYVVDFFCYTANLIIEIDGPIHDNQKDADILRQSEIEALGYQVLRFSNEQVMNAMEQVLAAIYNAIQPI